MKISLVLFVEAKTLTLVFLMMPCDHDVLMSYGNTLLKINSRQQSENTRYNIKKMSSILGKEFQIEIAKGLAKKFKLKSFFFKIFTLW